MAASTMRNFKLILVLILLITISSCAGAFSMAVYVYQYKVEYHKPVIIEDLEIPESESI